MLLMLSNGLSSPALRACLPNLAGARAAIIPTAIASTKARVPAIEEVQAELSALSVEQSAVVDIVSHPPKVLREFDLLYFCGGNAFLLMKELRQRGYEEPLRAFANEKPILGSSGGALALGQTLAHIQLLDPSMNRKYGLLDLSGLGLAPLSICPHKSRFVQRYPDCLARLARFEEETAQRLILLEDGEGVLVDQDTIQHIHTQEENHEEVFE